MYVVTSNATSSDEDQQSEPTAPSRGTGDRIVWIDCEMTGLSLTDDALIEVAALVTDFDLNQLGDGIDVVIRPPDEALAQMGDFVRSMHSSSGLLAELERGVSLREAEEMVLAYIRQWAPDPGKSPLGGNTVATDRGFLARDMAELESFLHYRIIDVSSIKELAKRWFPRAYFNAPAKHGGHRALADIRESIAELRYYRQSVFSARELSSPECRALAARHEIAPEPSVLPAAGGLPEADEVSTSL